MDEQVPISLPADLLDRVDRISRRTGRSRTDVITNALHRGLRDDERDQSVIDSFDALDP